MAENHELRLKIDASAAKRGSREFTAAITAVKRAVRDLERDSTGAFTKLQRNLRDVAAQSKVKISGIDKRSIRDLESFARTQQTALRATAATTKNVKSLISAVQGLGTAYQQAYTTTDRFNTAILKTNSSLQRQIQLASQARSAVRQIRTAPTPTGGGSAGGMQASAQGARMSQKAISDLQRQWSKLNNTAVATGSSGSRAFREIGVSATRAVRSMKDAADASMRQERIQLSTAAAVRRAETEVARLTSRLRAVGDTKGIQAVNSALIRLKTEAAGGFNSTLMLQKAMGEFASSTTRAKVALTQHEAAQQRAAQSAKRLATNERSAAANARLIEREMRSLAGATNATSSAFQRATGNVRGLENAFSGTFQVGSMFRTMLGSLTLGTFTAGVFRAGDALDQFTVSMEVATGSMAGAQNELQYVDALASRLGVSLQSARDNYSKFAISADIAGVSMNDTRKIFESVSTAMAVLGKGTEDQNLAFMALEQMMSKGKVSSEELRRQLGERLPGAVNLMAEAIGVSVSELQDLLKAGAIDSADALPKFAEKLQERFGPGLSKAMERAGYNLGTLRNEFTKFQETIAKSGFMQVLAQEFAELTNTMRSNEVDDVARKLGEGFAMMAQHAGEAASFIVEHFEEIGQVVKAVAYGVVVRQATFMAQALVSSAQQFTAFLASISQGRAASTAAEIAMEKHTAAVAQNTLALQANATASKGSAAAVLGSVGAHERAAGRTDAATRATGRFSRGLTATAGAMAVLTRGLAVIATPLALFTTAMLVVPDLFGGMEDTGTSASDAVAAAIRRAGVALDDFQTNIEDTSFTALSNGLSDVLTLEGRSRSSFYQNNTDAISGLGRAGAFLNFGGGQAGSSIDSRLGQSQLGAAGIDPEALERLTGEAKSRTRSMLNDVSEALHTGTDSFLGLRDAISQTMVEVPTSMGVLGPVRELITELALAEKATVKQKDALVGMFGTSDQKSAKEFTDLAAEWMQTGEGKSVLLSQIEEAQSRAPKLAADLQEILATAESFALGGRSTDSFRQSVQSRYAVDIESIVQKRKAAEEAARAAQDAKEAFDSLISADGGAAVDKLRAMGSQEGNGVYLMGANAFSEQLQKAVEEYNRFQDTMISSSRFEEIAYGMDGLTSSTRSFIEAAATQFSQLSESEQTYTALQGIIESLSNTTEFAGGTFDTFQQRLLGNVRTTHQVGDTYDDLKLRLETFARAYGLVGTEAEAVINEILAAARSKEDLAAAADEASGAVSAASRSMAASASSASAATPALKAYASAMNMIKAASSNIGTLVTETLESLDQRVKIAGLKGVDRAVAQEIYSGETGQAVNKIDADLNRLAEIDMSVMNPSQVGNVMREIDELSQVRADLISKGREAARNEFTLNESNKGGGDKLSVSEEMRKRVEDSLRSLEAENRALELVRDGRYETAEAAEMAAEAALSQKSYTDMSTEAMLRGIDAASKYNETLQGLAKDPVKEWMNAVPTWKEGARQIQVDVMDGLSESISNFITTGKFGFRELAQSIIKSAADIMADMAVKEMMRMFGMGDGGGSTPTGGGSGGAGAGGFFSGVAGFVGSLFGFMDEGGYATDPARKVWMPHAAFANAPHYSEGTPNTSGIPAILHDNEAVVPLSRGRKIPVEMQEGSGGGSSISIGDINVTVESNSDDPAEQGAQVATKIRESLENMIDAKIVEQMRYGGSLNPRGY